jgi:uncharacterized Ntn-hydrolase superfamily protein
MTFSIVARDPQTGDLGVAVQSHFFGVGSLVIWAEAGVGVIATQSIVEPSYGLQGLRLLAERVPPDVALRTLLATDPRSDRRQVAFLDARGESAVHTGTACIGFAGSAKSPNAQAQANLVTRPDVWLSMTEAFETSEGPMAARLLEALRVAESFGGDIRGQQTAAIKVVRGVSTGDLTADLITDLRVDDAEYPLDELGRLVTRSTAMSGLIRLLSTEGLLTGEYTASEAEMVHALAELDRAQELSNPSNHEATVWRGLLLARAGRRGEARRAFVTANQTNPNVRQLVINLAAANMWSRPLGELEEVLPD